MDRGYIKLWRKVVDNPLWFLNRRGTARVATAMEAWLDLLLMACHEPAIIQVGRHRVECGRGECAVSLRLLSKRWHWRKDRVYRFLKVLSTPYTVLTKDPKKGCVNLGCNSRSEKCDITQKKTRHPVTIITIVNYDTYQVPSHTKRDSTSDQNATVKKPKRDAILVNKSLTSLTSLKAFGVSDGKKPSAVGEFKQIWNEMARSVPDANIPKLLQMTPDRVKALKTRLASSEEVWKTDWREVIASIADKPKLHKGGMGHANWVIRADWILKHPGHLNRIKEGAYDGEASSKHSSRRFSQSGEGADYDGLGGRAKV